MKKEKYIIIGGLFAVLLIISFLVGSYGFVMTKTLGNEEGKKETFKSRTVSIKYSDGSETLTTLTDGYFNPGSTLTKTFTVSNTGSKDTVYSIKLSNVINDFERENDITFELLRNGTVINSGIFPKEDIVIAEEENIKVEETVTYIFRVNYLNSLENQIIDSGASLSASIVLN